MAKSQPLKYTASDMQNKIDDKHGSGVILLDASTYDGVKKKARFVHSVYGQWWTQPYLVAKGFSHPSNRANALKKANAWVFEDLDKKIQEISSNKFCLVKETYEAVGFKNVGETLGWSWTNGSERFNRLLCRATKDKTQSQNAAEKGWFKIYDAGQRKYQLAI